MQQRVAPRQAITEGRLRLAGQTRLLGTFFGLLARFAGNFPVVDAAPWPAGTAGTPRTHRLATMPIAVRRPAKAGF